MKRNRTIVAVFGVLLGATSQIFAGNFGIAPMSGDANSGISALKTYTHAVDLNRGGSDPLGGNDANPLVINGVPFASGNNSAGTGNYAMTGVNDTFNGHNPGVTGGVGDLLDDFFHNGGGAGGATPGTETVTLTGLTAGQNYVTNFYVGGFGGNLQDVTTSDDGATRLRIPRDGAFGPGARLAYHYTAPASGQITYTFDAQSNGDSFHQYGFSNETTLYKPILNLHNTGVSTGPGFTGTSGAIATNAGNTDPNYTGVSAPSIVGPFTPFTPFVAEHAAWLDSTTTSAWISPSAGNTAPTAEFYAFSTTFDTPTGAVAAISIEGSYSSDNNLVGVLIDGVLYPGIAGGDFNNWTPFSINTLVTGSNHTITWVTNSSSVGDPTGMRVVYSFAGFIPEPSSLTLLGMGFAGLFAAKRRRRAAKG